MGTLLQDVRYGLRILAKSPGFTIVAVLTLALGIGANTALFSVVNSVLLNPLPYPNPGRLVVVAEKAPPFDESSIAYPNFLDWVRMNHTFDALAAYRQANFNLTGSGEAQHLKAMQVSASFFSLLGAKPLIGRDFTPNEDVKGAAPVALLSEALWRNKFSGSPEIVGKTLTLDGAGFTVIGVIPQSFYSCCESTNFHLADIYVPLGSSGNPFIEDRKNHPGIHAVGRMKSGVTLEQARADMNEIARNLAAAYPDSNKDAGIALTSLKDRMVRDVRTMLWVLLAAVGFVLLIACVNVANLLLARALGRAREFAIRAALGAGRQRIFRQLLAESLLLAIVAGGLGSMLASWGTQASLKFLPESLPRAGDVRVDARVLLFTLGVSVLAGVLFGFAPALRTSRADLQETLREAGRGASGTRHRMQTIFVVVEMALAIVLLVGAGLTIRSLARVWDVDPGFDPHNVLRFDLSFPPSMAKQTPDQVRATLRQLTQTIGQVPGVKAVSLNDGAEPMNGDSELKFWVEGQPKPRTEADMPLSLSYMVSADYLKVMRIPLLRGRFFTQQDTGHSLFVCVIDENFARTYFPNQDPVGRRIRLGYKDLPIEIVGVVRHLKQWGLDGDVGAPVKVELFLLSEQLPDEFMAYMVHGETLILRTETPTYANADAIRAAIQSKNSNQAVYGFESTDQIVSDSLASRRFAMTLLAVFAAIALVLASIGIYGVISYVTQQRTHEIGVRMALGAQHSDVLKLVFRDAVGMTLVGVPLGLVAAALLTQLIKDLLFGVSARDPLTFAGVAILISIVGLAACYIPARRAMCVDPMVALRFE